MLLTLKNKVRPWIMAIRPKTLTAAITPVLVATILSFKITGKIHLLITFAALLSALSIQIGANLINDACDFKMGADTGRRLGPKRATLEGLLTYREVFAAGTLSFIMAALFAVPLIIEGGAFFALLLALSILSGYLYTYSRYSLAYNGLGDIFVFIFFGLIACNGVFWLQTKTITSESLLAGGQMGLLATVMIAINNFRDIEEDARARKKTLACRFGKFFARVEITFLTLAPFLLNIRWYLLDYSKAAFLSLFSLPLAIFIINKVWRNEPSTYCNRILTVAALLHQSYGWLLNLGFLFQ